jgi:uncharacterized protein YoxC
MNSSSKVVVVKATARGLEGRKMQLLKPFFLAIAFTFFGISLVPIPAQKILHDTKIYSDSVKAVKEANKLMCQEKDSLAKKIDKLASELLSESINMKSYEEFSKVRTRFDDLTITGERDEPEFPQPLMSSILWAALGIIITLISATVVKNKMKQYKNELAKTNDRIEINIETGEIREYLYEKKTKGHFEFFSGIDSINLSKDSLDAIKGTGSISILFIKKIDEKIEHYRSTIDKCDNPDQAIESLLPFIIHPEKITIEKI